MSITDNDSNGQPDNIHQSWIMLKFTLYDLATSEVALDLHTQTKAGQYNYPQDDGEVVSFYAPVNLLDKALEKSADKLTEVCSCK